MLCKFNQSEVRLAHFLYYPSKVMGSLLHCLCKNFSLTHGLVGISIPVVFRSRILPKYFIELYFFHFNTVMQDFQFFPISPF